ncbi:EAL domain-containing protein [bacterium]|nr:EAL domain-containing protein [bacterium]MBU1990335.1 EAL domain-containing protein [bacterium]
MKSKSHIFTGIENLDLFLRESLITDNSRLLIQIFTALTFKDDIASLMRIFAEKFPDASLIGATHDGAIMEGKLTDEDQTVVSFTQFLDTDLKTYITSTPSNKSYETGSKIAKRLNAGDIKAIITFSDGILTNGEEYIKGLSSVNSQVTIAGGMAGDHGLLRETYIFTKNRIYSHGAVAVGLYGKSLQVTSDYSFNWIPIGKKMLVTKAKGNHLYELDGQSAISIYEKYMSKELALRLPQIGIEFPLILEREGIVIGRAVLDKEEDGSLIFAGNIYEGEYVRFGIGNIEQILRDSEYHAKQLSQSPAESIFIYSCMARRRFMGSYIETELEPLNKIATTAGFFTYGEFFYARGKSQLLNETMTVLALSESPQSAHIGCSGNIVKNFSFRINPLHVLSHLANTVSKELEQLNETLEKRVKDSTSYILKQVYKDRLTDLPNRLRLLNDLGRFKNSYLILININDFTSINDFYGHKAGDEVLRRLGEEILLCDKGCVSNVYRLGSDEFAIISTDENISGTLQKLYKRFNNFVLDYEHDLIHITMTSAASRVNEAGTVLANADMALKRARRENKPYLVFNEDMLLYEKNKENIEIAKSIRIALGNENIILYYQPIVNMKSKKIEKYESLVRLVKENKEILMPLKFLDISQKIRLYPEITKSVILNSCKKFQNNDFEFSINFSISDILNTRTQKYLFESVEQYGVGGRLIIEILETQSLEDDIVVNSFIKKAQSYGIRIAIDDFGSGFANFQHITRINADILKIDGSLIKIIDKDENARLVVETLVIFAKKLKMKTVAEFVHSKEIYDIIKELEIDYAQGYYIGKPSPYI